MSVIRKQSILSTLVIYAGFAIGLLNTYLFTRQGLFTEEEFGLYNAFIAIATLLAAAGNLGAPYFIYKFYPYYRDHLRADKNDQLTVAILLGTLGCAAAIIVGFYIEPLVIKKYATNAPQLVNYYHWTFLLGAGLLLFTILEAWNWQQQRAATSHFLKEAGWRLFILLLIGCFATGLINSYDVFIKLFAFSFPLIALLLLLILLYRKQATLAKPFSRVSQRLSRSATRYTSYTYCGTLIFTIAQVFDTILIASVLSNAMTKVAVYSLAQNMASLVQVPQRGVIAAAMGPLSTAWKQKDMTTITKIYQRSSINQLIVGAGLLVLLLINYTDAVEAFQLKSTYLQAFTVLVLLGMTKLIDMGTGVNSQIIVTSPKWRFEFISGVLLLVVMLPLSYWLTKKEGIVGTAMAQLISIGCYNLIRLFFLWKKFNLQPFSLQSLYTIGLAAGGWALCHFVVGQWSGWVALITQSLLFVLVYAAGVYVLQLTPDIKELLVTLRKRGASR
ncbi:MAG: lipopolysaccharide biosynthesis protein [Sphingomonadales bacterium]